MDLCVIDSDGYDEKERFRQDRDTWHEPITHPESSRFVTRSLWLPAFAVSEVGDDAKDLASRFESLRQSWHREYGASSSFRKITSCHSYREIVRMGKDALPFIFEDLRRRPEPDYWFEALAEITQVNPVAPEDKGYPRRMAKAWLKWARTQGYG